MSSFSTKFNGYTMTQLNELLEDDEKLSKMVQEMDEMQGVQQTKEKTLATNRTLAEQNLTLQPQLEHKKEQLTKSYGCLQESYESYQLRKSRLGIEATTSQGSTSLDTLLALLQTEGAKIEEETENMADSFLDGDMPLDAFIDSYQNKRKLAHLRRVKIEKLQEMVQKGLHLPRRPPVPSSRHQDVPVVSSLLADSNSSNHSPVAPARRKPPAPPSQPAPIFNPAPTASPQPPVFCQPSQYPPIPPRTGAALPQRLLWIPQPLPLSVPPALPQRPPPRLAPQPGFIIQ